MKKSVIITMVAIVSVVLLCGIFAFFAIHQRFDRQDRFGIENKGGFTNRSLRENHRSPRDVVDEGRFRCSGCDNCEQENNQTDTNVTDQ